jgi:hypothetical protein
MDEGIGRQFAGDQRGVLDKIAVTQLGERFRYESTSIPRRPSRRLQPNLPGTVIDRLLSPTAHLLNEGVIVWIAHRMPRDHFCSPSRVAG